MNTSIIKRMNDIREEISYNKTFIFSSLQRNRELSESMDKDDYVNGGISAITIIKNNKEMMGKRRDENFKLNEELNFLDEKMNNMLKHFRADKPLMQLGRILGLLSKEYISPFSNKTEELWVIINYAIENNKRFYLQYKTLIKECFKIYDDEDKIWRQKPRGN